MTKKALLVIDIQNDFLPGGSLAVPAGDEVIAVANDLMRDYDTVIATQDWHPADHLSFASQHPGRSIGDMIELGGVDQVLWPNHCVEDTTGAEFASALDTDRFTHVFRKGQHREIDSYSGFFDNDHRNGTGLADYLQREHITAVDLIGLATDYCVLFTALDAIHLGLTTTIITAGVRGVNLQPNDCELAFEKMRAAGVGVVT